MKERFSGKLIRNSGLAFALLFGSHAFAGCSLDTPANPESGIVTDKETKKVDGVCLLSSNNVCLMYDEETEYKIKVAACGRLGGETILIDEDYARRRLQSPSDFPIIEKGVAVKKEEGKDNTQETTCGHTFDVSKAEYESAKLGDFYTD